MTRNIFHLAIPSQDLAESLSFYAGKLGLKIGRKYPGHFVMDFYGSQVVCHFSKSERQYEVKPQMYPRHFGVLIPSRDGLLELWLKYRETSFVADPYFVRKEGEFAEHHTFFLKDPSNNLIEFKWYLNEEAIFG